MSQFRIIALTGLLLSVKSITSKSNQLPLLAKSKIGGQQQGGAGKEVRDEGEQHERRKEAATAMEEESRAGKSDMAGRRKGGWR